MKKVAIYTDGACRGNPGQGGWGVLLRYGKHEKTLKGYEDHTTNNRMELTAAIEGLASLTQPCEIDLYTDSQYVQKGITEWLPNWKKQNWKAANRKEVKNKDLWQALENEIARHKIHWHWIKGHNNHPENDQADALANLAIDEMKLKK